MCYNMTMTLRLADEESTIGLIDYTAVEPFSTSSCCSLSKPVQALTKDDPPSKSGLVKIHDVSRPIKVYSCRTPVEHTKILPLPAKKGTRAYRSLRWTLLSTYRRLFSLVFVINLAILISLFASPGPREAAFTYSNLSTAVAVNLLVSVTVRHELFVNLLFIVAGSLPSSTPLVIRRWAAKVYAYGGVHSGCAIAAIVWYLAFAVLVVQHSLVAPYVHPAVSYVALGTTILLITIAIMALPSVRRRHHNAFESSHRFGGWAVLLLFWAQTVILASVGNGFQMASIGRDLSRTPSFWCLVIITWVIVYPWLRLRYRSVRAEKLSAHALRLHFDQGRTSYCQALRLADRPLMETHAFAPIPNCAPGQQGFSVIISDAGDWTRKTISQAPSRIWTRGGPQYGALYVARLFSPVVVVATGSGIGPCLSLFRGRPQLKCRVLWSTPNPMETYGEDIVQEVMRTDSQALIIDTRQHGRPDLVGLAHRLYREASAEAVVVISNHKVTRKVVVGLETRGVPAYGPIFDS